MDRLDPMTPGAEAFKERYEELKKTLQDLDAGLARYELVITAMANNINPRPTEAGMMETMYRLEQKIQGLAQGIDNIHTKLDIILAKLSTATEGSSTKQDD